MKPPQRSDAKRVNKSEALREMIAQHPDATSKEIVHLLGEKGLKVQPSLAYYVRSKQRQQDRRLKREKVQATSQRTGNNNPVELVLQVKRLALEAGGIKNLQLLVNALAD
jgi:hypothetical protein